MSKIVFTLALSAAFGLAFATEAFAHAALKSATPAIDGTVTTAPTELDLTFSEDINLKFSGVKITGPDKTAMATGAAMLMNKNMTLMVPITGTLAAGTYTVSWRALSADGHKTHGTYTFTVKP